MASQLSLRLLQGYKFSSNCNAGIRLQPYVESNSPPNSISGSHRGSGYSADSERTSISTEPPVSIDLPKSHKRKAATVQTTKETKRRKVQELNYAASMAKSVLADAGLDVPSIRTRSPRSLPKDAGIDLSRVDHMYSSTVGCSPFLGIVSNLKTADNYHNSDVLSLLVQSCQSFYDSLPPIDPFQHGAVDCGSSTSSVTDTDVSGSCQEEEENDETELQSPAVLSIGDALSICKEARLITLSEEPFTVVHVNAAFTKMTGFSSVKVQGRKLKDFVEGDALLDTLKRPLETLRSTTLYKQEVKARPFAGKHKSVSCAINVSPVGPRHTVTHFAMQLKPSTSSDPIISSAEESSQDSKPLRVLG